MDAQGPSQPLPRWVVVPATALLPVLVIVLFDWLEGLLDGVGLDGGIVVLLVIILLFISVFVLSAVPLWFSAHPVVDGLLAGAIAALALLAWLSPSILEFGGFIVVIWAAFAAFFLLIGAGIGSTVRWIRDRQSD